MKDLQVEPSVLRAKDGSVIGRIIFQHVSLSAAESEPSNYDSESTADIDPLDLPPAEKVGFNGKPLSAKSGLIGREYIGSVVSSDLFFAGS